MKRFACVSLVLAAVIPIMAQIQEPAPASEPSPKPEATPVKPTEPPPVEPVAKAEPAQARIGAVIIHGFGDIGAVTGDQGTQLAVKSHEFSEANSRQKEYSISITAIETAQPFRTISCIIEYDELDPLLKGIEQIGKVEKTVTRLPNFEATYRTRGTFAIKTLNGPDGKVQASVQIGLEHPINVTFNLEILGQFRSLIQQAKAVLDDAQKP